MRQTSRCGRPFGRARWSSRDTSGAPIRTLHRTAAVLAATLAVVAGVALPAWAQPTFFAGSEAEADTDHQVGLRVPEDERVGRTVRIEVTAPAGFEVLPGSCTAPAGWSCEISGRTVTYLRGDIGLLDVFGFSVHTPVTDGAYRFPVAQVGEADSVSWSGESAPVITVTGGEADGSGDGSGGDGTGGDGTGDGGTGAGGDTSGGETSGGDTSDNGTSDGGSTDDGSTGTTDDGAAADEPTTGGEATRSSSGSDETDDAADPDDGRSGSTAPRRTRGRTSGSTIEVVPASPDDDGVPAPDAPAVADDPAVAPPAGTSEVATGDQDGGGTIAAGEADGGPRGGGTPWQRWAGATLLLAGAGIVGVRRWRDARA